MYIWDVELERFPLGWKEIYEEAKRKYPLGTYIDGENKSERYDPVEYLKRMKRAYRELIKEAKHLTEEETDEISRLFSIEFLLWGIVWDYTHRASTNECFDPRIFNSEYALWAAYEDFDDYFYSDYSEYLDLKIEKLVTIQLRGKSSSKYVPYSPNLIIQE